MMESSEKKKRNRFAVETVGCRLNQYETEKMANQLSLLGFDRVEYDQEADLYLVNTCTVTGRADASCRNVISRATRRENGAVVVVVGCYVDSEPEKLALLNGVDLVVGNSDKSNIVKILNQRFPSLFEDDIAMETPQIISGFYNHSRAWVKISDGCNQKCAYCIIPRVRGKLVNRPASEIADEINLLSKNGFHEVVLTGVHIGQYCWDKIKSIAELMQYILDNTDIPRLRLSSIEPQEVKADILAVMKNGGRRICRHLHVPLQSGSDQILSAMRRPYSAQDYLSNLRTIKENIEGVVIGADIIVGFPGETENDFDKSIGIIQSELIDYLHVFSYSDRPGTDSSEMPNKIKSKEIKRRNKILRDISDNNYIAALNKEVGQSVYAISLNKAGNTGQSGNHYWGITDNFLRISFPEKFSGSREIHNLNVTGVKDKHLIGTF